jgi:hypothetical protein
MSASFRELGPIVPLGAWRVVGSCELPVAAVGRADLVVVDCTAGLNRGGRVRFGEGTGQWQWWWRGQLRGEGAFGGFGSTAGQRALAATLAAIVLGHVGIVDGAVVPIVGVPQG